MNKLLITTSAILAFVIIALVYRQAYGFRSETELTSRSGASLKNDRSKRSAVTRQESRQVGSLPGHGAKSEAREVKTEVAEEMKSYRIGAYARTHARLASILSQSGLTEKEIDQAVGFYMEMAFANTKEEREAIVEKMKSLLGVEVYEGMEKAEEHQRNSMRDDQLLKELQASMPTLDSSDIRAAKDGFAKLPSYHTLFMQELKFQPMNINAEAKMRVAAERAFDEAFAQSRLSAPVYQKLKQAYVSAAVGPLAGLRQ
jgi:hypothetical protein